MIISAKKRCQCYKMITCAGTVKSSSGATVRLKQNKLHNRECCLSDLLQQLKQTVCRPMIGHRDDWRHRRFERSPTAGHFHFADHGFLSHASVCCLKHNHEWSDSTRKLRGSFWIRRLHTLCPLGINKVTDSIWPYGRTPGVLCSLDNLPGA